MRASGGVIFILLIVLATACVAYGPTTVPSAGTTVAAEAVERPQPVELPDPKLRGEKSLEEALSGRRSIREYSDGPLTVQEVSQILWAAQGLTAEWGGRTAPSAGGLYPLETYLVVGNVYGVAPGTYKYIPTEHELVLVKHGDLRKGLGEAALGQKWVEEAAVDIVIAAVFKRTTGKYGDRGVSYVWMEAGHAGQNICLQATALDLGAVTVGAFFDDRVKEVVGMAPDEVPLYIIPVGRRR